MTDGSNCLTGVDFTTLTANATGVERESLRVTQQGAVATTFHPAGLGHKLTHPHITVDFSEGLLELVTAPHARRGAMQQELAELHRWTARQLPADELLWAPSMPPNTGEDVIAVADFGPSLSGRMKEVYRRGLAHRYGKVMQIIAGVHFNFSFDARFTADMHARIGRGLSEQQCRNRLYFRLIRGFDRHAWLLPWLFGASPIAANSSNGIQAAWLQRFDAEHVWGEFATSLRMSEIGYRSPAQRDLHISHRDVEHYVHELVQATRTPWPEYQRLGVCVDGEWRQLNDNILQIENEYYSPIRPKQLTELGERPACALLDRGVRYIEVRMLDVDPFSPLGISEQTAYFLEVFLLTCLAGAAEEGDWTAEDEDNQMRSILYGRQPGLKLRRSGRPIALAAWADEFLDDAAPIAERLDAAAGTTVYAAAVDAQRDKLRDPARLPSQRVVDAARRDGYGDWALGLSREHTAALRSETLTPERARAWRRMAEESVADARALATRQTGSFADYVQQYFDSLCDEAAAAAAGGRSG